MDNNTPLLAVRKLRSYFNTDDGLVKAVDDVSFRINRRQTFALVGESGCGKSVTAFSILRLLPMPPAMITSAATLQRLCGAPGSGGAFGPGAEGTLAGRVTGSNKLAPSVIEFEGEDLLEYNESQMRQVRGGQISMIFQEPMSSLNPVYTCGNQIVEAIQLHRKTSPAESRDLAIEMLAKVGIPAPAQRYNEYPHQMSGGMRQRVMIAMALSCNPRLLIADEPTTALDVTIQAQILDLLRQLQANEGLSILLITHDLAVVAECADVVAVMYASKIVELTDVHRLYRKQQHPYTQGLFRSLPKLGEKKHRLETISGNVPNPLHFPGGCKFHPRCLLTRTKAAQAGATDVAFIPGEGQGTPVLKRCALFEPSLRELETGHWCACWEAQGYEHAPQTDPAQ